jgi:hypothetical protein
VQQRRSASMTTIGVGLQYNLTSRQDVPPYISARRVRIKRMNLHLVLSPRTPGPRRPIACLALASRSAEQIARSCGGAANGLAMGSMSPQPCCVRSFTSLSICMKLDAPGLHVFLLESAPNEVQGRIFFLSLIS